MLAEVGVTDTTPRVEAWNKLDLVDGEAPRGPPRQARRRGGDLDGADQGRGWTPSSATSPIC
ncbi:hypothetical protein AB5I41_05295 [Sphingomonas sp. MMS24-JH45]